MHWADVEARNLLEKGNRHLISTGISPSGFIHVGSLRESITAEALRKSLAGIGADVSLIYLVDSFDPLRKRYAFLSEEFETEVGKPLSHISCPCSEHDSYAHHFIKPFLDSLEELGVHCDVHWTHELYEKGTFAEAIDTVIAHKEKVIQILREVTGREVSDSFFPYTPRCDCRGCFVPGDVEILSYEYPYVTFNCPCGDEERADIRKDDGKLPWRIEWAAKWKIFGVTCEPFGKDHAAAGGSYDSGVRFAKEVFDIEPPHPIAYEFIQLKGKGQMHKSSGSVVTGIDALRITPAEVLNFLVLRYNPDRHIDYDPGLGIIDSVDEYDRYERLYYTGGCSEVEEDLLRAYQLAQPKEVRERMPVQVPYRHLVSVIQIGSDFKSVLDILKRTEHLVEMDDADMDLLRERMRCVRYWLNSYAPDMVRFQILDDLPEVELDSSERGFLECILSSLEGMQWEGEDIHNAVYECTKSSGTGAKKGFQVLYKIFIGRTSGPRLGHFLSTLDKEFVIGRIKEALF
ncbi:MAG: lysine--tRNA ligase [Methanomassiliicoccales archaeon]|nr:lysine--tRNA ligase [Methanomassiliicoccales archaeon]